MKMIYFFTYLKITVLSTKYMVINNKQNNNTVYYFIKYLWCFNKFQYIIYFMIYHVIFKNRFEVDSLVFGTQYGLELNGPL